MYLYALMESYQVEIVNRLFIGPCFGFSIYLIDEDHTMGEWIFYLGLISIHIKYYRDV